MKYATLQFITRLLWGSLAIAAVFAMVWAFTLLPQWLRASAVQAAPQAAPNALPVISFSSSVYNQSENAGSATITVQISAVPTQTVTVNYATGQGSALPVSDYTQTSGTITFTATSGNALNFSVPLVDDNVYEGNETVNLFLQGAVNATLGTSTAVLTINDNESPPTSTPTRTPTGNQPIFSDQYEPNDTFANATQIAAGQEFCNATLWPVGDQDYFTFFAKDGFSYRVYTDDLEPGVDTVMTVYDPQGDQIASNDDFQNARRSEVTIHADQDGFYFARIINQDPSDPADKTYCFGVTEQLPPTPTITPTAPNGLAGGDSCEWNSIIEYACLIGVGETKANLNFVPTLGSDQDTDMFRVWVKVGIDYTCETLDLSAYADTNIILLNQNGQPFNPPIGNDDRLDATGNQPDLSSKVSYKASYTGWLYVEVGPVNIPTYEEASLQTYSVRCNASVSTATPIPTATAIFVPPATGGTGGTSATSTPQVTATIFAFPTPLPTATPFTLPTATPTPTPPVVQFQPLPTATSIFGGGQNVTINVTLFYDSNNNFMPELPEGIANVAVFLFDSATGNLLVFGTTNETGTIRFADIVVAGPIRVVVPFLNYNQIVVGGNADLLLRIAPQPLPIGIP